MMKTGRVTRWTLAAIATAAIAGGILGASPLAAQQGTSAHAKCLVEKNVNVVMVDTLAEDSTLFATRFSEITLDQIAPRHPVSASVHARK